jgi:hypothetical protein
MKHRINRLECSSLGKARICFCFSKSLGEEIFGESLKDGQCTSQYFSLVALPINGCRAASLRARLARGARGEGGRRGGEGTATCLGSCSCGKLVCAKQKQKPGTVQ